MDRTTYPPRKTVPLQRKAARGFGALLPVVCCLLAAGQPPALAAATPPAPESGSHRELFVDHALIERIEHATLRRLAVRVFAVGEHEDDPAALDAAELIQRRVDRVEQTRGIAVVQIP